MPTPILNSSRASSRLLILVTTCLLSGCGTFANLNGQEFPVVGGEEPTTPFGGVSRDVRWVSTVTPPVNLYFIADIPASFVGDLVTLPQTISKQASAKAAANANATQSAANEAGQPASNAVAQSQN